MSYAIRATRIEDGQTKFWADGREFIYWSEDTFRAAKYETVSAAHSDIRNKLCTLRHSDRFAIDIVPVQS